MAKSKSLEKMNIEELEGVLNELNQTRDELTQRIREVSAVLRGRQVEADARRRVESMTDEQKAAVAQVLQLEGIKSEEAFGELG